MDKKEIRFNALERRDSFTPDEIESKSRSIFEALRELPEYDEADRLLIYASMGSEVRTDDIILDALGCGKEVFCPKVTDKNLGEMEFVRINFIEDLSEGFYGIREPEIDENSEVYRWKEEDRTLVIMPGVAFDSDRNRVGYSGGYYDRYLSDKSELFTVALAFDCQFYDEPIPAEHHDIRPALLITETGVYGQEDELPLADS